MTDYFLPMFRRTLGGEFRWCAQWWQHGEAISRLTSLWHAWEVLRLQPGTGIGVWYRDHLDHQLPILMGARGPFYQCSETAHREPHEAAAIPAPGDWWDVDDADDLPDPRRPPPTAPAGAATTAGYERAMARLISASGAGPGPHPERRQPGDRQRARPRIPRHCNAGRAPRIPVSRLAAGDAAPALARVGYQVARINGTGHRDLLVTGWSPDGLESRLTAMRAILHQLDENPGSTADAVIERFRRLPGPPGTQGAGRCPHAAAGLGERVIRHSRAPQPRDHARRRGQRAAAGPRAHAGKRDRRPGRTSSAGGRARAAPVPVPAPAHRRGQAKEAAIRRASITFHLNATPPGADAPVQHPAQPPARDPPRPGTRQAPRGRLAGQPARRRAASPPLSRVQSPDGRGPAGTPGRRALPRQPAGLPPLSTGLPRRIKEERAMAPPSRTARTATGACGDRGRGLPAGAGRPGAGEPAGAGGARPAH